MAEVCVIFMIGQNPYRVWNVKKKSSGLSNGVFIFAMTQTRLDFTILCAALAWV